MADTIERKKLIDYLPPFMRQFTEMKQIMRTEDYEMDKIDLSMRRVLDNAFIEDCDEYGIRKYESLLKIVPSIDDTLESRKRRVSIYWNNFVPYTYWVLVNKLDTLCGVNNYDIYADLENYIVDINIYSVQNVSEVKLLLQKMLPENIVYNIYLAKQFSVAGNIGIVWQDDEIFDLRQVIL